MLKALLKNLLLVFLILQSGNLFVGCSKKAQVFKERRIAVIYPLAKEDEGQSIMDSSLCELGIRKGYGFEVKDYYLNSRFYENSDQRLYRMDSIVQVILKDSVDYIILNTSVTLNAFIANYKEWNHRPRILFNDVLFIDSVDLSLRNWMKGLVIENTISENIELAENVLKSKVLGLNTDTTLIGKSIVRDLKAALLNSSNIFVEGKGSTNDYFSDEFLNSANKLQVVDIPIDHMSADELMGVMDYYVPEKGCSFLNLRFSSRSRLLTLLPNCPVLSTSSQGFFRPSNILLGGYFPLEEDAYQKLVDYIIDSDEKGWVSLPQTKMTQNAYQFDYNYLRRWNIPEETLPKDSIIYHKPFLSDYTLLIFVLIGVLLFILQQVVSEIAMGLMKSRTRKRQAEKIENEQRKLMLSLSGAKGAVWSYEKGIFKLDENLQKMLGVSSANLPLQNLYQLIHPEDRDTFKNTLNDTDDICTLLYRIMFYDGRYHWVQVHTKGVKSTSFLEAKSSGILFDYQQQKEHEYALIHSQKMAEKAELKQAFLANMSHEIRNPLNTIVGFSNLLSSAEAEYLPREVREEYMEVIVSNSKLLEKLLDGIMDISSIQTGAMDFTLNAYPVERLVREIYQAYSVVVNKEIEFRVNYAPEKMWVNVDKLRYTQVMDNFLSNSNKFTTQGFIEIGSRYDEARNEVHIYVKDTGKGISQEHIDKIFDRFYKCEENAVGTGLGLPLCKLIAEKLNGRIEVVSHVGQGSIFTLVLPCVRKEDANA